MKKFLFAFVVLITCAASAQQVARNIPYAGAPTGKIGFLEFRPADYGSQKHPLIIFLHGIGERGDGTSQIQSVAANGIPMYCKQGASMQFTVNGQTSSFVVLSPQLDGAIGYWPTWYVDQMIAYAKANLQIDPNRIYVTGLSLGGGGAWRWAMESYAHASLAAAVGVSCGTDEGDDNNVCNTLGAANTPVWAFHCKDDGTVTVGNTQHVQYVTSQCTNFAKGNEPRFTYYLSGGHGGAWTNAYDPGHITRQVDSSLVKPGASSNVNFTANPNIYEWFLMHTRNSLSPPAGGIPVVVQVPAATTTKAVASVTVNGNTLILDGTGSTGTGRIQSSGWRVTDMAGNYVKPQSVDLGMMDAGPSANPAASIRLANGTYNITLTIQDQYGGTAKVVKQITVGAVAPAGATVVQVFTAAGVTYTLMSDHTWK